jgi:SAM-dependent methyltransferase
MNASSTRGSGTKVEPRVLYSRKPELYLAFIRAVGYPRGLAAYLAAAAYLRDDMRVLDAGCGTGILTLALRRALEARGLRPGPTHGFDLTPAMLERFRATIGAHGIEGIELAQCDVLDLAALPAHWSGYELVASAAMMEYLPRTRLAEALAGLGARLAPGGTLVLFVTRRNWLTRPLIGRWWEANLYSREELQSAFAAAGFNSIAIARFPPAFRYLDLWGHIVEAKRSR